MTGSGRETILSGMQPSGALHLGNLEGALKNWVRLQREYDMYLCIVDWHALTSGYESPQVIKDQILQMGIDFLAAGLDPKSCAIFIQSDVLEHAELHLIFSMLITVPTLTRLPTYLEKKEQLDSYGFLGYPVLQAADILIYNADKVPVGKDQEKHIWLTKDLAERFNQLYGPVFHLPEAMFTTVPLIPGTDNRKMSKSYDNHVPLEFTAPQTEQRIRTYFTDPNKLRKGDPGNPDICPVFTLHKIYSSAETDEINRDCRSGALGCVDCKKRLAANVNAALEPLRQRRREFAAHPDEVWDVLVDGGNRARKRAQETMAAVRHAMNMDYHRRPA